MRASASLLLAVLVACSNDPEKVADEDDQATVNDAGTPEGDGDTGDGDTGDGDGDTGDGDSDKGDGDGDSPDSELVEMVRAKLASCDVLDSASSRPASALNIRDEFDRCIARCQLKAPCDEIKTAFCGEHEQDSPLDVCAYICGKEPPADGFECDDGKRIPHRYLCDLHPSCSGGEDEADCGTFTCDNGKVVASASVACDVNYQCLDGTDEMDCAFSCRKPLDLFTCANKIRIPADKACDGSEDCADGSDEEESFCGPPFVCDNGSVTLEPSLVCDEVRDCGDGTDEENCE